MPLTRDDVCRLMGIGHFPDGWDFIPVYRKGQLAGFFCTQGAEIHCFRIESFKGSWLTHQDIERLTLPIFAEFGCLLTKVRTENLQGHSFVARLGFFPVGIDETSIHYKAERLNHARH
jgi:hypothetical protein